ncbi:MAG TPA: hypothetical protein DHW02_07590 [Ktedonobacter sp.]|nr:hypothetical protein [Ktedonobacter sp.]
MAIRYIHEELENYQTQQQFQTSQAQQQQAYDSTLKSLFQDQTLEMISTFIDDIENPVELNETALRPSLRVDRAYLVHRRGKQRIVHIELETSANSDMPLRMLEYYGILYRKYQIPIIPLIICPFKTSIRDSPLVIVDEDGEILIFKYRIARLWKEQARKYLDAQKVAVYALLPTMEGANYALLSQALDEMKAHYTEQSRRFAEHLLWFNTLLQRTDTVSPEDKERIREKMSNIESLLDENLFVQKRRAEGFAEGEARGKAEGEAKGRAEGLQQGLQFAVITALENRFPPLTESVRQKISHVQQPERLQLLLKAAITAPDEKTLQSMIDLLAA